VAPIPAPDEPAGDQATPEAPDQPSGEEAAPEAPDQPTGEQAAPQAPDQPVGEQAAPEAPDQPTGEPAAPQAPDQPAGEQAAPATPAEPKEQPAAPPTAGEPAQQREVPPSPALPGQGPLNLPALPTDSGPWIPETVAVLQGLDKVTARVSSFDAPLDKPVHFGTLEIIPHACFKRPPEEPPENAAFLEIREIKPGEAPAELFTGWMFSTSPALSSLEHPVYDIWVVDCKNDSNSSAPSSR
jgi:hypothetical protein